MAFVHDYLSEAGGAERVLRVLSDMYPSAPIYTAFAKRGTARAMFHDCQIVESKWAWLLKMGRAYSYLRFLLPWVWKNMDLTKYDLVITSCSGYIARGFRVGNKTKVIAYCHTPPRWLYGYDTPTGASKRWWGRVFMWVVGPFMRYFDYMSAQRVDTWVANSKEVARRIEKFYRKKAVVVWPPIEIQSQKFRSSLGYYLIVSRIVGGKGIEEADQAAESGGWRLCIVGEVVDTKMASRLINYEGSVNERELSQLYARARGFIALAQDEDFGMTVVEAMSCGTPVLAYNGGGYRETVVPGKTGIFTQSLRAKEIGEGIKEMESIKWDREAIKKWAGRFGRARFEQKIRKIVEE